MSFLRPTLKRATLLASRSSNIAENIKIQKAARLSQVAPSRRIQPTLSKFENNIVTSTHADCTLHGMNLVHRFFENASRWKDKIALVS